MTRLLASPEASSVGGAGTDRPLVGVLALQGDYLEHELALQRVGGVAIRRVRTPAHLEGLDALVLPGGESTTMLRLLDVQGLIGPLESWLEKGLPVLATCAGVVLLAREVRAPAQRSLARLDVVVERNGYGRQVHSGTVELTVDDAGDLGPTMAGVFIRAPRLVATGPGVEVLARRDGDPVLVRQGPILGACFHPELTHDHAVTRAFVAQIHAAAAGRGGAT